MNIEELAKEKIEAFKIELLMAATTALDSVYCDVLPHAENDTYLNVEMRAQTIINNMLAGKFKKTTQDNTVLIPDSEGIDTPIKLTDDMYDNIRKNLIEFMPVCPKDLEIKALKKEIESLINYYNKR